MQDRVIYIKGGRAVEEARRLFPRLGELPDGGPDKFLLAVIHYAKDACFRLVSLGPETIRTRIGDREVVEYGARSSSASKIERRFAFLRSALSLLSDSIAFRPTRVLCGLDGPIGLFAWLAARLTGAQFVFLGHSALAMPTTSKPYKLANRFLCSHADTVIAHGPFVKDEAIRLGARAGNVIEFNNALDPQHIALIETFPARPLLPTKHIIVYVGRIEEDKGVIDLFNAYLALPTTAMIELRFIGEGGALAALSNLISSHRLGGQVMCTGGLPYEEVFRHVHEATILVAPSQSRFPEGFCKSVMEAFYVGTPAIVPDYGPFPYMVDNEVNGLIYASDSVSALSRSLSRLIDDPILYARVAEGARRKGVQWKTSDTTFASAMRSILA